MRFSDPNKLIAKIKKDVADASAEAIAKVDQELDRVISSDSEFSDLGFSAQDIIDTERLFNSKVIAATPDGVTFTYDPVSPENGYHYAPAVFLGFFAWGKKYIPGRPWTHRAVRNENPVTNIAAALESQGYQVRIKRDGTADLFN